MCAPTACHAERLLPVAKKTQEFFKKKGTDSNEDVGDSEYDEVVHSYFNCREVGRKVVELRCEIVKLSREVVEIVQGPPMRVTNGIHGVGVIRKARKRYCREVGRKVVELRCEIVHRRQI